MPTHQKKPPAPKGPAKIATVADLAAAIKHDICARHDGKKERKVPKGFYMRRDSNYLVGYVPKPSGAGDDVPDPQVFYYPNNADCFVEDLLDALGIDCEGV